MPDIVMHNVLIFFLVNPDFQPANADLAARGYQIGCTPEVYKATNLQENASGAAMRMDKP